MRRPGRYSRLSRLYSLSRGRGKYAFPLGERFYAEVERAEKIVQEQEKELFEKLFEEVDKQLGEYAEDFAELNEKIEEELRQMSRRAKYSRYNRYRLYAEQDDEGGISQESPELEELNGLLKELGMRIKDPDESTNGGVVYMTLTNVAKMILKSGMGAIKDAATFFLVYSGAVTGALAFLTSPAVILILSGAVSSPFAWWALGFLFGLFLGAVALLSVIVLIFSFAFRISTNVKVLREVKDLALQALRAKEPETRKNAVERIREIRENYKEAVAEVLAKLNEKLAK